MREHALRHGLELAIRRYPAGTHTAEDAARAIGCDVVQIVKSLVFVVGGEPVVALVSGADRVDEAKLSALLEGRARRATANEVRDLTAYVVGGVPPFGHRAGIRVLVDRALLGFDVVWAAAGLPDAVFPIAPADLVRASGGRSADIAVSAGQRSSSSSSSSSSDSYSSE